jgi:hypothetical protein
MAANQIRLAAAGKHVWSPLHNQFPHPGKANPLIRFTHRDKSTRQFALKLRKLG